MAKNIPFFDMFSELNISGVLRLKLGGAELTHVSIELEKMAITMALTTKSPVAPEDMEDLKQMIRAVYGFRTVEMELTSRERLHCTANISADAELGEDCVVGQDAVIPAGVVMDDCIVWPRTHVAPGTYRRCILTPRITVQG